MIYTTVKLTTRGRVTTVLSTKQHATTMPSTAQAKTTQPPVTTVRVRNTEKQLSTEKLRITTTASQLTMSTTDEVTTSQAPAQLQLLTTKPVTESPSTAAAPPITASIQQPPLTSESADTSSESTSSQSTLTLGQERYATSVQTSDIVSQTITTIVGSTTTSTLSIKTTPTTKSISSTLRTTVSTTVPSHTDLPPTNAPLKGSSIPGREAQNEETQAAQQLTQTLADIPTTEKQQMGYQADEFLLDCQYAGYSCSPSMYGICDCQKILFT